MPKTTKPKEEKKLAPAAVAAQPSKKSKTITKQQQQVASPPAPSKGKVLQAEKDQKQKGLKKKAPEPIVVLTMPKNAKSAYNIFNTEFVLQIRSKDPDMKTTEAFKLAGQKWATMTEQDKAQYQKLADEDKTLHDQRVAQQNELGYFVFEDGTKSTDDVNKDKVRKVKQQQQVEEEPVAPGEEEYKEIQPTKARSAYIFFVSDFMQTNKTEGVKASELAKKAGEAWKAMAESDKQQYEKKQEADRKRHAQQLDMLKKKGFFMTDDGTKSTDLPVKNKKRKAAAVAVKQTKGNDQKIIGQVNKRQKVDNKKLARK